MRRPRGRDASAIKSHRPGVSLAQRVLTRGRTGCTEVYGSTDTGHGRVPPARWQPSLTVELAGLELASFHSPDPAVVCLREGLGPRGKWFHADQSREGQYLNI